MHSLPLPSFCCTAEALRGRAERRATIRRAKSLHKEYGLDENSTPVAPEVFSFQQSRSANLFKTSSFLL
ncbi:hypothetical protein EYF80_003597 [Liparis tanakae]|uniref:Uncharacterized protein n=1 Tax=Liparis tanakae TaxID=230148 RepID=A0A4Z2J7X0_9TELE|nr:hypothetical protein EYF80_003597 [Liparis tanakae]